MGSYTSFFLPVCAGEENFKMAVVEEILGGTMVLVRAHTLSLSVPACCSSPG